MEVLRRAGGRSGGSARRPRALRDGVVVTEVALSFILLVGAGLMLRSFVALGRIDPGYDPSQRPDVPAAGAAGRKPAQRAAFKQQVRERAARDSRRAGR